MHIEVLNQHVTFTHPKFYFGQAVLHKCRQEGVIVGMKFMGYSWGYEICFVNPLSISKLIPEKELRLKKSKQLNRSGNL
jgi:hypothetical protein